MKIEDILRIAYNKTLKDYPSLLDQLWKNNIKVKKSQNKFREYVEDCL